MNHMDQSPILYVEDDENDVYLFRRAFTKTGHRNPIHVVTDGLRAIDYLMGARAYADRQQHPLPKLMIIDLKMPRMTGFELLLSVRQQPAYRTLPIVVLSSSNYSTDIHTALASGANGYLIKSPDSTDLIPWLHDLLTACAACDYAVDGWLPFLGNQPLSDPNRDIFPLSVKGPFRGALNAPSRYAEN